MPLFYTLLVQSFTAIMAQPSDWATVMRLDFSHAAQHMLACVCVQICFSQLVLCFATVVFALLSSHHALSSLSLWPLVPAYTADAALCQNCMLHLWRSFPFPSPFLLRFLCFSFPSSLSIVWLVRPVQVPVGHIGYVDFVYPATRYFVGCLQAHSSG